MDVDGPLPAHEAIASVIARCGSGASGRDAASVPELGAALWTALTGRTSYDGTHPRLEQTGSLTVALNRILRTAYDDRYASALEMRDDLERALRLGEELVAVALPRDEEPPGPARSGIGLLLAVLAVVLIAVLVGGLATARLLDDGTSPLSSSTPPSR